MNVSAKRRLKPEIKALKEWSNRFKREVEVETSGLMNEEDSFIY